MNWLYYLAEANLYLCVFYLAYCVFLVKETHYQLNRAYLLLSCLMAFILPVLQVGALRPSVVDNVPAISYSVAQPSQYVAPLSNVSVPVVVTAPPFSIDDYLWVAYLAGAVVVLLLLTLKLYSVFRLTRNSKAKLGSYKMVYLKDTDVAFSFFNYLFIGTRAAGANTIITHELVHIRQKHSADIMFLELLKVICWFNPCIYLLQNSLKTVHEYIADEQTAATEADALTYSSFLVNNAYGAGGSSITHSFFNYNLLKKRIIMLNQQRSGKLARLKYLVALPVCAGLLCASTLAFSKSYGWIDLTPADEATKNENIVKDHISFNTQIDTLRQKKPNSTLPKPKVDRLKFTLPAIKVKKTDVVKFPPRYVVGRKGDLSKLSPPPAEPPKPKVDQVKFPPKRKVDVVKFPPAEPLKPKVDQVKFPSAIKIDVVKFPPPQSPKPKVDQVRFPPASNGERNITNKGYKFEETGFLIGKETNFRVIIHEKNGEEKEFFKNSSTKAQLKLLKDKYGYTFPDMEIWDQMPPPPPMPSAAQPTKPTSSLLNQKNSNGGNVTRAGLNNVVYDTQEPNTKGRFLPLIIVNNQRYTLSKELQERYGNGEHLVFSATDSTVSYVKNTPYAISKWGPDAAEGVVSLYGKTSITTTK